MVVLLAALGAVLVLVIALVAVGRESFTLGAQPKQAHFDLEEAVEFVADRLPDDVTAVLTYDDVRSLLRWHLEYLRDRGVPVRRDQTTEGGPVVVEDDEGIAWVLGKADEAGLEVTDTDVATVLEVELAYFEAIGAIGGEAPGLPDV
ncbi:MAG: hypothetical protein QOD92_1799 [Acidimicrobiaceae bacterium]|jgi:hypothetical protein